MCKKPFQIDGLDFSFGEEGANARFGTFEAHSKQDTRYNASLVFFSIERSKKALFLFLFYSIVLLSLLRLIAINEIRQISREKNAFHKVD